LPTILYAGRTDIGKIISQCNLTGTTGIKRNRDSAVDIIMDMGSCSIKNRNAENDLPSQQRRVLLLAAEMSKLGAKARFLDEEISGMAVSTYPQYEFKNFVNCGPNEARSFSFLSKCQKRSGGFICPKPVMLITARDRMNLSTVL